MIKENKSLTISTLNDQTLFEPVPFCKSARAQTSDDATTWKEGKVANCLNTFDIGETRCNELIVEPPKAFGVSSYESNAMKSPNPNSGFYEADTSRTLDENGGNPACNQGGMLVVGVDTYNQDTTGDKARTLLSEKTDTDHLPFVLAIDRASFNQGKNAQFDFSVEEEIAQTVVAKGPGGVCTFAPSSGETAGTLDSHYYLGCGARGGKEREIIGERITYCTTHGSFHTKAEEEEADTIQATDYKDPPIVNDMVETQYIVRRLTPTECGRLQGMPDWWCSDVEHSDAAEYKMWGNGMALPNILYVVENTVRVLQKRRRRAE